MNQPKQTVGDRFKKAAIRTALKGFFEVLPVREMMGKALAQFADMMKKAADHLERKELAEDETSHAMLVEFKNMPDGSVKSFAHLVAIVKGEAEPGTAIIRRKEVTSIDTKARELTQIDVSDRELIDQLTENFTREQPNALESSNQPKQLNQ